MTIGLTALTGQLRAGEDLPPAAIAFACDRLLDESESLETRADFLRSLAQKGETPSEVAAFIVALLDRAIRPPLTGNTFLDVCGTGGDKAGFFNISTAVMFVVAACGVRVVKHGNRGITSKSGGADVLEALGVKIDIPPDAVAQALDSAGCCFLFAPLYHPAFKAVAPVRKTLAAEGITTVFNLLGPLLNPARPDYQLAGVFDPRRLPLYAEVFILLGRKKALAVHGSGPAQMRLDEVSTLGPTDIFTVENGVVSHFSVDMRDLGLSHASPEVLAGGDAMQNAGILTGILSGSDTGPRRDIVLANAAMALVAANAAADPSSALNRCREALSSGAAFTCLERLRSIQ